MSKTGSYLGGSTLVRSTWFGSSGKPSKREQAVITKENEQVARERGLLLGGAELAQQKAAKRQKQRELAEARKKQQRKARAKAVATEFAAEAAAHRRIQQERKKAGNKP